MLNDQELAVAIGEYMDRHPYTSRFMLRKLFKTSEPRLKKLKELGLLRNVPAPMSNSQAATYGRSLGNKWGKNFKLRGTP